ncbi:hypothetical protein MN116_003062 [Schistosoma mekongi]|uniref:Dendritic cell-specific transmembrane protein-like domain-containing protein n=1 Tax=Schistosoma mekongi TaxID=38744 RepID=A0AAE1ZGV0_SCHME|nr:hypothetical protein MN116_003062 [Schistosoma mekongi]
MAFNIQLNLPTNLITKEFNLKLNIVHRLKSHLYTEITLSICCSIICTMYWILILMIKLNFNNLNDYQLKINKYLVDFWHLFIIPYIVFSLLLSIYTMLILMDDIGFIKDDISNYINQIFDILNSRESTVSQKVQFLNHLESLQYDFSCCGANSYMNWLLNNHPLLISTLKRVYSLNDTSKELLFGPWMSSKSTELLPFTCCDGNKTFYCSMELLYSNKEWNAKKTGFIIPIYSSDCVTSITSQITSELDSMSWMYSSTSVGLHVFQILVNINTYGNVLANIPCNDKFLFLPKFIHNLRRYSKRSVQYNTSPLPDETRQITHNDMPRTYTTCSVLAKDVKALDKFEEGIYQSGLTKNLTDIQGLQNKFETSADSLKPRSDKCSDDSRELRNFKTTLRPDDARQKCCFYESIGYVSNSQLLNICQSFYLFAEPSKKERNNLCEGNENISRILKDSLKQSTYVTYLPKLNFKINKLDEYSKFHYYLRKCLPLFEALLYTEGSEQENKEADFIYGGFLIFVLRRIIFIIFGYISSKIIMLVIRNIQFPNDKLIETKHLNIGYYEQDLWNKAKLINVEAVEKLSDTFLMTTLIISALISLRVRCLLLLIIPTFGLTVGHIFLVNQLVYTLFAGPLTSIKNNMKVLENDLICLEEAAHNIPEGSDKLNYNDHANYAAKYMPTDIALFYNKSNYLTTSLTMLELMNEAGKNLSEAVAEYMHSLPSLDKLVDNYKAFTNMLEKSYPEFDFISKTFQNEAKKLSYEMNERFQARHDEYYRNVKIQHSQQLNSNKINMNTVNNEMKHTQLEFTMLNYLLHKCIAIYERKFSICLNESKIICEKLTKNHKLHGIWLNDLCADYYQSNEFCELFAYIKNIKDKCTLDVKSFDLEFGFSNYLNELYKLINGFNNNTMKIEILLNESDINKQNIEWINVEKEINDVQYIDKTDKHITDNYLNTIILSTSLLRLIFILLIYLAHKYISYYLLNVNVDNLYHGKICELGGDHYLNEDIKKVFPRRSGEKLSVSLNHFSHTWLSIKQSFMNLLFVIIFGLILMFVFYLDSQIFYVVNLLNDLLLSDTEYMYDISDSDQRVTISTNETRANNTYTEDNFASVTGNGTFKMVTARMLQIIKQLNYKRLDDSIDHCVTHAHETSSEYKFHFYSTWLIFMLLAVTTPTMLCLRQRIVVFFYPQKEKIRRAALCNYLLTQRCNYFTKLHQRNFSHGGRDCIQECVEHLSQ